MTAKKLLPEETNSALKELIRLSEKLLGIAEKQTQAIIQNDMIMFAILVQEQESVSARYADASSEFRLRMEEFRGADNHRITKLESLQNEIKEKINNNSRLIEKIKQKSSQKTHDTLFTVQELAARKPVNMNEKQAGGEAR